MATNHQEGFDPAIKRPGRFDLLLFMGPPEWEYKLRRIDAFLPKSLEPRSAEIAERLRQWTESQDAWNSLDLYTFGDMRAFLEHFCMRYGKEVAQLPDVLEENGAAEAFRNDVREWREKLIALWGDQEANPMYKEYLEDRVQSRRQ